MARVATIRGELAWARLVERQLYLVPPVIGVGIVGVLQEADPGVPLLESGLVLVGTFGYSLLSAGIALSVCRRASSPPARRGERALAAEPVGNALFALLWAPVAGVFYLYRRHKRFGTRPDWSGWWLVVAASLATTVIDSPWRRSPSRSRSQGCF